eukprot:m.120553 g.120553  ORF g.120553 m.120553 type:complete len:3576 (+) comp37735_c0_seq2:78-10805(+)
MLERYLTPLFFSYIEKYVKNLAPSDFQLSLWQGDVSLNNLELKLDVIESELGLPFQLVSGKIRQLRVNVPWTSLGSEPVKITVETLECVLKLKGRSSDDGSSSHGVVSANVTAPGTSETAKSPATSAPPGYVQSWTNKIVNNVQFTFKNVVLNYIEDDILLSVNIQEAEVYSVDENWKKAFVDVYHPGDAQRKVCLVQNLTVCLDKRDGAGKILCYQEPLLYRCCFSVRVLLNNQGDASRLSCAGVRAGNSFDILVEKFDLAVSDFQLPMFVRLAKRCVALHYGSNLDGTGMPVCLPLLAMQKQEESTAKAGEKETLGWTSWAFSLVAGDSTDSRKTLSSSQQTAFSCFGVYINHATFLYKIMEKAHSSQFMLCPNYAFRPAIVVDFYSIAMVTVSQGSHFFDYSLGISGIKSRFISESMAYAKMDVILSESKDVFFRCGSTTESETSGDSGHLRGSLFDPSVNAASGSSVDERHSTAYAAHNLEACAHTFKALWLQYRNTLPRPSLPSPTHGGEALDWLLHPRREATEQVVLFGHLQLTLSKQTKTLLGQFVESASNWNQNMEPFPCDDLSVDGASNVFKEYAEAGYDFDFMTSLGVAMKSVKLTCSGADVVFMPGSLGTSAASHLSLKVSKLDNVASVPVYPDQLTVGSPGGLTSPEMPDDCYLISNYNVTDIKVVLTISETSEHVLFSCPSADIMTKTTIIPTSWLTPSHVATENAIAVGSMNLQATSSQCLLALNHVTQIMTTESPQATPCLDGKESKEYLHVSISNLMLGVTNSSVWSSRNAEIGSLAVNVSTGNGYVPILFGPLSTENISMGPDSLIHNSQRKELQNSLILLEHQKKVNQNGGPTATSLVMQGIALNVDHGLYSWISTLLNGIQSRRLDPSRADNWDSCIAGSISSVEESQKEHATATQASSHLEGDQSQHYSDLWKLVLNMTIKLEVASIAIFFPSGQLTGLGSLEDSLTEDIPAFFAEQLGLLRASSFPSTIAVCLPKINVFSHQCHNLISNFSRLSPDAKTSNLPWAIQCQDLSVYTLEESSVHQLQGRFIIRPFSFDVTLVTGGTQKRDVNTGMSSLAVPSERLCDSSVSLCCHIASSAATLELSRRQIELVLRVSRSGLRCLNLVQRHVSSAHTAIRQPSIPARGTGSATYGGDNTFGWSSDVYSTPQLSKISATSEERRRSPLDVFQFWFQLTLPKVAVNLYGRTAEQPPRTCLVRLELEDLAASVDVFSSATNGKFSLGGVSVKHFQKPENGGWVQGSDGGVLLTASHSNFQRDFDPLLKGRHYHNAVSLTFQHQFEKTHREKRRREATTTATKVTASVLPLRAVFCLVPVYVIRQVLSGHSLDESGSDDGGEDGDVGDNVSPSKRAEVKLLTIPNIHFDLDELVAVFPGSGDDGFDDVLLLGMSGLSIRPHPFNPIARPVMSDGHELPFSEQVLEDQQLELLVKDVSLWTTKWDDLPPVFRSGDLLDPTGLGELSGQLSLSQNPALQWNLSAGESVSHHSNLVPLAEKMEIHCVVAPAISSVMKTSKKNFCRLDFGHSLEISFRNELTLFLNDHQLKFLLSLTEGYRQLLNSSVSQSSSAQSIQTQEKSVPVDILLTATKLTANLYHQQLDSSSSLQPLLHFGLTELLFHAKGSNLVTVLSLNIFNCHVNSPSFDAKTRRLMTFRDVRDKGMYPVSIISTRSGRRSSAGVLPSLLVCSITLPVAESCDGTTDVSITIGRPLRMAINAALCNEILDFFDAAFQQKSLVSSGESVASEAEIDEGVAEIPNVRLSSSQCVVLLETSSQSKGDLVATFTGFDLQIHRTDGNDENLSVGSATLSGLSVKSRWFELQNYLLLPIDLHATLAISRNPNEAKCLFLSATPIELNVGTLHAMLMKDLLDEQLDHLLKRRRRRRCSSSSSRREVTEEKAVRPESGWESKDDLRNGSLRVVVSADPKRRPLPSELVVIDGLIECPPLLAWRYPEPRLLKRLHLSPIDEGSSEKKPLSVFCCLYYWDHLSRCFTPCHEFSIQSEGPLLIDLSEKPAIASEWQIKFIRPFPANDASSDLSASFSAKAFVKRLKIDSHCDLSLVANVRAIISCPRVKLTVADLPSTDRPIVVGGMPYRVVPPPLKFRQLEVMSLFLEDVKVSGETALRGGNFRLQVTSELEVRYVDFTTGEKKLFFDISTFHADFQKFKRLTEMSFTSGGCRLTVAHSSIDAATKLNHVIRKWTGSKDNFLLANCHICNNSLEVMEVTQADSPRRILLKSGWMTELMWESSLPRLLTVTLLSDDGEPEKGVSDPFLVEKSTSFQCRFLGKSDPAESASIFADVESKGIATEVTLVGGLSLRNFLAFPLEVSAMGVSSGKESSKFKRLFSLLPAEPAKSLSLRDTASRIELTVRQIARAEEQTPVSDWSSLVAIPIGQENSFSSVMTFTVPLDKTTSASHNIGCTVVRQKDSPRTKITFVPLCRIRNLFPDPLVLQLEAGNDFLQRYAIPGKDTPFDVPFIEPDVNYRLSCIVNGAEKPSTRSVSMTIAGRGFPTEDDFISVENTPWPYLDLFKQNASGLMGEEDEKQHAVNCFVQFGDQQLSLDVLVRVHFSPVHWTLAFQPPGLITNSTSHLLAIHHAGLKSAQAVAPGETVNAVCKLPFRIGMNFGDIGCSGDGYCWSDVLESLLLTEVAKKVILYSDKEQDENKSCQLILIEIGEDKICHLHVKRTTRKGLTIIEISNAISVCNMSSVSLSMMAVIGSPKTIQASRLAYHHDLLPANDNQFRPHFVSDVNSKAHRPVGKIFPSLVFSENPDGDNSWSVPLYLRQPPLRRLSFSVPSSSKSGSFQSLSASFHSEMGHYYVTISDDTAPRLVLSNDTFVRISVGQALPGKFRKNFPDVDVVEDILAQNLGLLSLQPKSSAVYEFPTWLTAYMAKPSADHDVYLCFRREGQKESTWSRPVLIPFSDEFEAEENVDLVFCGNIALKFLKRGTAVKLVLYEKDAAPTLEVAELIAGANRFRISATAKYFTVRLRRDTQALLARDVVLLTVEKIDFKFRPSDDSACSHSATLTLASFQLDNQATDIIDFPVVAYRHGAKSPGKFSSAGRRKPPLPLVKIELSIDTTQMAFSVTSCKARAEPVVLLLEDKFLYVTLDTLRSYADTASPRATVGDSDIRPSPQAVCSVPVAINLIEIQPFTVFVSLRASMGVFLSSDQTKLAFDAVTLRSVFSQPVYLTEVIVQSYVTATVRKGGWLLGSLDLLGSPASFLRNFGSGVRDLVLLPYEGLTRGPRSFVGGVGRGITACFRQLSTGTLSSVVNVASSVSRNLELMSLDRKHVEVQERMRRQPNNVASGLRGVGLSLLGAVAGLVDQPVRSLETSSTGVKAVGSLASGVGKGLLGAVTKPVGAAFELVSVTGKGIMRATGLTDVPARRNVGGGRWERSEEGFPGRMQFPDDVGNVVNVVMVLRGKLVCRSGVTDDVWIVASEELVWLVGVGKTESYFVRDVVARPDPEESQTVEVVCERNSDDVGFEGEEELPVAVKVERFLSSVPEAYGYKKEEDGSALTAVECPKERASTSCSFILENTGDRQLMVTTLNALRSISKNNIL